MSYGTYRNCTSTLVRNGLLIKTAHGGGPTAYGRGTGNQYRVNSPVVQNPHPAQSVLPDIVKSPEASPPQCPQLMLNRRHPLTPAQFIGEIDEMLAIGITPDADARHYGIRRRDSSKLAKHVTVGRTNWS